MSIVDGAGGFPLPPAAGAGQPGGGKRSLPSGTSGKHVYPKRAIFRMLLLLAWERGEMTYSERLTELLRA